MPTASYHLSLSFLLRRITRPNFIATSQRIHVNQEYVETNEAPVEDSHGFNFYLQSHGVMQRNHDTKDSIQLWNKELHFTREIPATPSCLARLLSKAKISSKRRTNFARTQCIRLQPCPMLLWHPMPTNCASMVLCTSGH
jgi:hypothetical protein